MIDLRPVARIIAKTIDLVALSGYFFRYTKLSRSSQSKHFESLFPVETESTIESRRTIIELTVYQTRNQVRQRYKVLVRKKGKTPYYQQGISEQALNDWCRFLQVQLLDESHKQRQSFSPEEIQQLDNYHKAVHIYKIPRNFYRDRILMQGLTLDRYLEKLEQEQYPVYGTDDRIDDPSTAP
jgi:hypothetical protein